MLKKLRDAIIEMREDDAIALTNELLEGGFTPAEILGACKEAMDVIGERFSIGEAFIPELILAGDLLSAITEILKPHMSAEAVSKKIGKVVMGTVQGDIHNIAKDIVCFMLDLNGFEVIDLGVDVSPVKFVEAAKGTGAKIVGLSGFLTLAFGPMKDTVAAFKSAEMSDVKIMIGGGQVDEAVRTYTGADAYGKDAIAAVSLATRWSKE